MSARLSALLLGLLFTVPCLAEETGSKPDKTVDVVPDTRARLPDHSDLGVTGKSVGHGKDGKARVTRPATPNVQWISGKDVTGVLLAALGSKDAQARRVAARTLGRLGNRSAFHALAERAVIDGAPAVRKAALAAVVKLDAKKAVAEIAKSLHATSATFRMRAATALAELGDTHAVTYLVHRFEAHGGGAPRVHTFVGTQRTFVQDYDVEVA